MEMAWKRKQCRRKAFTVRWYLGMGGESERIGKDQKGQKEREKQVVADPVDAPTDQVEAPTDRKGAPLIKRRLRRIREKGAG